MNELSAPSRGQWTMLLRLADVALVMLAGYLCWLARTGPSYFPPITAEFLGYAGLLTAVSFHSARVYEPPSQLRPFQGMRRLAAGWGLVVLLLFALGFITKSTGDLSRIWIVLWFTVTPALLLALRLVFRAMGAQRVHVAVVGAGEPAERFLRHVRANMSQGLELVGLFGHGPVPPGQHTSGNIHDLLELCRRRRVDRVIIALPWEDEERILEVARRFRNVPVDVDLGPCSIAYRVGRPRITLADGLPMLSLNRRPLEGWSIVVKQVEDTTLALLLLLFISPVLLLLALAVKLDSPGPVLFRQKRYGYNNRIITVFKFRSMRHVPQGANGEGAEEAGVPQARRNDPRVTRLGAILRRTSLDELPQLFNVLDGSMSLVGPRPHAVPHNEHYGSLIAEYDGRHNVKPGITGWAQINGYRGETATDDLMRKRVEYDLYYVRNWSLRLDLLILLRTAWCGFTGDRAY